MLYLDTNAIIHLKDKGFVPTPAQRSKLYVSMLGIQELLKNIQSRIKDETKASQTLSALRWIQENGIRIHWKSVYQAQADAFDYNLKDPLTERIQALYEAIVSSDDSMVISIVEAHTETINGNELFLKEFYGDIRTEVNHSYRDNNFMIQNYSNKQREKLKAFWEESGFFNEMNNQFKDSLFQQGIANELDCFFDKTGMKEQYYATMLNNYTGGCNSHIKCLVQFALNHSIGGPIQYNDMTDLNHTYYLFNRTCKIITDDKTLVELVRKGLGRDRYAMTVDEYLLV